MAAATCDMKGGLAALGSSPAKPLLQLWPLRLSPAAIEILGTADEENRRYGRRFAWLAEQGYFSPERVQAQSFNPEPAQQGSQSVWATGA